MQADWPCLKFEYEVSVKIHRRLANAFFGSGVSYSINIVI